MAMNSNTSSKYDNISKVLIHSGSPALYQLTPKEENIGTLKRMTLGKKDLNKINKTILLVGETGAGKSTLVNALVNFAMGVKWKDNVWFKIVEEEKKSQSESQTSDVIVYEICGCEGYTLPYSLTIIDTPGFGDTRGTKHDARISERLLDLLHSDEGVNEINVVGLVMKASENRLSERLRYIFDSVLSLFGDNMEKNIVALITHSDGVTPKNVLQALNDAEIKCAKDEQNNPCYYLFNNRQSQEKIKKETIGLKMAWGITEDQMDEFTKFLKETEPQKLMSTIAVLKTRMKLTGCIQNLQERVEMIELKQREIQQIQEGLKKHEEEMKSNEDFKIEVDEVYKDREPIEAWWDTQAVCCTKCGENCHYPGCTMAVGPSWCEVMKDGRCTSCTGKCPVSDHVKKNWKYVTKTRKVQWTLQDLKEKYDQAEAGCEETTGLLENLQNKLEELQQDKDQWLEKSYEHVLKLEHIALNVNSLSTLVHLDFLIEKMNVKGDTEKVQKLEEMKSRANEGTRSGLWYAVAKGVVMEKRRTTSL